MSKDHPQNMGLVEMIIKSDRLKLVRAQKCLAQNGLLDYNGATSSLEPKKQIKNIDLSNLILYDKGPSSKEQFQDLLKPGYDFDQLGVGFSQQQLRTWYFSKTSQDAILARMFETKKRWEIKPARQLWADAEAAECICPQFDAGKRTTLSTVFFHFLELHRGNKSVFRTDAVPTKNKTQRDFVRSTSTSIFTPEEFCKDVRDAFLGSGRSIGLFGASGCGKV